MVVMGNIERDNWRQFYPFQSNWCYLPRSGAKMHFIDEKPQSGEAREPIVCLHGNPTWSFYYRDIIKAFRSEHRVIVPDHLGMGLSEKIEHYPYSLKDHIDNLEFLLHKLNVAPFTLVVHDWGGAIGMGYAVRHPEMIKHILFMNTAAYRSPFMPATIRLARLPIIGDILLRGLNLFVLGSLHINTKRRISPHIASGYLAPYDSWHNRVGILRFVQDIPMEPHHKSYKTLTEIEEKLSLLNDVPKIFMWGALDHVFNDRFYRRWQSIYPEAEFNRMEDVGHYVMEDASERVIESLRSLIER